MNTPWKAVWLLAVEVAGVVAVTGLIAWRLRSVVWQRTLWQASLLGLTGLLLVEFSSLNLFRASGEHSAPVVSAAVPDLALSTPAVTPIESSSAVPVVEPSQPIVTTSPEPFTMPELAPMPSPKELAPLGIHAEAVVQKDLPKDSFPLALALVLGVWAIGALVLASRLLVGRFILLRFCARSQTVFDVALFDRVQGIARKLGLKQSVQVLEASRIHTPVVFGLFRLTIALPAGFTERFDRRQQEAILAHELAHLAARDPLWYLLADGLVSVLWWHPLVWLARSRLQVTSEMAADEACVLAENGPETLAECLVTIAQEISTPGSLESIGIEGSGFRSRLGQRVERLLNLSAELAQRPSAWRTRVVKLGLPVVLVGVTLATSGWMGRNGAPGWADLQGTSWVVLNNLFEKPITTKPVRRERMLLAAATMSPRTETGAQSKLDTIKLKKTIFNRMPLDEVVQYLNDASQMQDAGKLGVDFSVEGKIPLAAVGNLKTGVVVINAEIPEGRSLRQVMDAICAAAEFPIQYEERNGGVVFLPKQRVISGEAKAAANEGELVFNVVQPKLDSIIIPKLQMRGASLSNALAILQSESKAADPEGAGLEVTLPPGDPLETAIMMRTMAVTIDPPMQNLSLREAIDTVLLLARNGSQTGLVYRTTDTGVRVEAGAAQPGWQRVYRMDMGKWVAGLEKTTGRKLNPPWQEGVKLPSELLNVQSQSLRDLLLLQFRQSPVGFSTNSDHQIMPRITFKNPLGILLIKGDLAQLEQSEDLVRPYLLANLASGRAGAGTNSVPLNKDQYEQALSELLQKSIKSDEFLRKRNQQYFPAVDLVRTRSSGAQVNTIKDFVPLKEVTTNVFIEVYLAKLPQERLNEFGLQLALGPADGSTRSAILSHESFKRVRDNLEKAGPFMQLNKTNYVLKNDNRGRLTGFQGEDYVIMPKAFDDGHTVELYLFKARTDNNGHPRRLMGSGFQKLYTGQTKVIMFPASGGNFEAIYVTAYLADAEGKKFSLDTKGPYANGATGDPFMQQGFLGAKISQTILPKIGFTNEPLWAVAKSLSMEVNRILPPDKQIYFFLNDEVPDKAGFVRRPGLEDLRITIDPPIEGKSIDAVLKAISASTPREIGKGLKHVVTSAGVMWLWNEVNPIAPAAAPVPNQTGANIEPRMFTAVINIDPEAFVKGVERVTGKKASGLTNLQTTEAELVQKMARLLFVTEGASMDTSTDEGAQTQLIYNERTGGLFVRAALADEEIIMNAVREVGDTRKPERNPKNEIKEDKKSPVPNPVIRTNSAKQTTPERQRILQKLDKMVIKVLFFDGRPLSEVAQFLHEESVQQDPEKVGVNFTITPTLEDKSTIDLEKMTVKINPYFRNLTFSQALEAISHVAAPIERKGLMFTVEDNGVVFRPSTVESTPLFVQRFKVDLGVLQKWLVILVGENEQLNSTGPQSKMKEQIQTMLRRFFAKEGVNFSPNSTNADAPQMFYNDKTGILLVRATLRDLESIQLSLEKIPAVVNLGGRGSLPLKVPSKTTENKVEEAQGLLVNQVFRLRYVNPTNVIPFIAATFSDSRSRVLAGSSAKTLMVNAVESDLKDVERIIRELDVAPKQTQEGIKTTSADNGKQQAQDEPGKVIDKKAEVAKLVEEGRRLFESKKDEEAETKFMEVMRLDPDNQAPHYYLNQIAQDRLARKRDADQRIRMAGAPRTGSVTNKGEFLPMPNPYVRTQAPPGPSKERLRIEERLDNTVLKELFFDGLPLTEVVRFLQEESAKLDPAKRGVNFVIDSESGGQLQPVVAPLGDPIAVPKSDGIDLTQVLISIKPPLKNLTMREALAAITSTTARAGTNSLAFSVNDYAVVFRKYEPEPPQMFVRRFKVDTDSFMKGLKKTAAASGLTSITTSTSMQDQLREFFRLAGVGTNTNSMTASQIFFNDTTGILLVRATLQDLEVIQQAIEVVNMVKPQVTIEARYIEVPESVAQEMGLKWFTGSLPPATNLQMHGFINVTIPTNSNVRVDAPVLPNHVSVLSTSQGKELLKQLEQKSGVNILASPRLTTLSQRQAQIAVGGTLDIVTGKVPNTKEEYQVSKVVVGSTLDVVPVVSMDGYSVQLTWIYNLTEFKGFDRPAKDQDKDQPLPRFSVRQVGNTSVVRDGETLMFGAGVVEKVLEEGKRGGIFHAKPKTEKKHIIIMLTPTVVDAAGNPVNKRS